jgi:tRNA(Leu) C34 or U34 (ribose-2'-O)-methylase TrmL
VITVASLWEADWMDSERTERRIWGQTINAYNVDRWIMSPGQPGKFTSPEQFEHIDEMFEALEAPRTFLVAPGTRNGIPLDAYTHPEDAIYVFGNAQNNLCKYIRPQDDVVTIYTPTQAAMFGHAVVGTVLFDRARKQ